MWRFEKAGHNLRSEVVQDIQDDVDRWRHHHHHHYVDRCRHHLLHQRRIHLCNCNHHQHHHPPLLSMKQMMVSKHLARAPEEVLLPNQSDSDEDFLFEVVDQDNDKLIIILVMTSTYLRTSTCLMMNSTCLRLRRRETQQQWSTGSKAPDLSTLRFCKLTILFQLIFQYFSRLIEVFGFVQKISDKTNRQFR